MANPQFMAPPPPPPPPPQGPQGQFPPPQNQQYQGQNPGGLQSFGGPPSQQFGRSQSFAVPQSQHTGGQQNLHNHQRGRAANVSAPYGSYEKNPRYEGITLRKDPNLPYGMEPSWSRIKETPTAASHEELAKMAKKKGKDSVQKDLQKLKSDNQRYQIEQALTARRQAEWNPDVEWSLVLVDEERGPGKKPNETETKVINLILKRQLKGKAKIANNNRRASETAAFLPGIVRDLRDPQSLSSTNNQGHLPRGPQGHNPGQGISGPLPGQNGPPNFQNQQMGPFPMPNQPHNPPQFQMNQNGFRPQNVPPPPPPLQTQQAQQNFQRPGPPAPPPPPPPPQSFPLQGKQAQGGRRPSSPHVDYALEEDSDDSIVIIESNSRSGRSERGSKKANRSDGQRKMSHSSSKGRSQHHRSNSSDSENSSYLSKNSSRFTNITSPTSGGSFKSLDLKRSKSGRDRRYSEMDNRSEPRSRGRRGSNSYSDDVADDYMCARARRNSSVGRDGRHRDNSRSPSYRGSAYDPRRAPTTTELLQEKALLRLERLALDEEDRFSQSLRDRDMYERERSRRSIDGGSRYGRSYDRSPSRYSHGRRLYN